MRRGRGRGRGRGSAGRSPGSPAVCVLPALRDYLEPLFAIGFRCSAFCLRWWLSLALLSSGSQGLALNPLFNAGSALGLAGSCRLHAKLKLLT